MSDPTVVEAMTNTTSKSCVEAACTCDTMWSLAQQFSYLRLSDPVPSAPFRSKLVSDYAVRARRIAATYARCYLEQESGAGSDPSKKGRFYWMALAAFASKTVACTLEDWRVGTQAAVLSKKTQDGLGKGNFWLFCDISGWHWYYALYPGSFDMCRDTRNSNNFVPAVKTQTAKLPWNAEALPMLRHFGVTDYIKKGFRKVREFETQADATKKPRLQMDHLLAIADHEQRVVLQPLIYDNADFSFWVRMQRTPPFSWVAPGLELVFTSACTEDDIEKKSVAPEGTELEKEASRMRWIGLAADMFHMRMQKKSAEMDAELHTIADWVGIADQ